MLNLEIKGNYLAKEQLRDIVNNPHSVQTESLDERLKLLIIRDLLRLDWKVTFSSDKIIISPPDYYDREIIRDSMSVKREEVLVRNKIWIDKHIKLARENLADGDQALNSKIEPVIDVCKTQKQHDTFRIFRYYWSSPYSDYVGRRIKLLVRDKALPNKPVIGIAALGSPIIHIPERDDWIGWDRKTRTKNLVYAMDAYVLGALPPYNYLLGGKLMSYIIASNEIRSIYRNKYRDSITRIEKRKASDLVCIFTTSLYGKSIQYNRVGYNKETLYKRIGETKGYGTLHLTEETFAAMQEYLKSKNILITNNFGDGPSWRMRIIRQVGEMLGFDPDFLLKHSFKRCIYVVPLAKNYKAFLNDQEKKPEYYDYPLSNLVNHWKIRWLENRKKNPSVINNILDFKSEDFKIF